MVHFIESLKNSIVNYFQGNKAKEGLEKPLKKPIERQEVIDCEESSLLIDENDRNKMKFKMQNWEEMNYDSISLIVTKSIPLVYLSFGVMSIVFMLAIAFIRTSTDVTMEGIYSEIGPMKSQFISFFNLQKINHFVFHVINSATALTGMGLVIAFYMIFMMKLNQNKSDHFQYLKLNVTVIYGLVSHLAHFMFGAVVFMDSFDSYNKLLLREIHISIYEFLFGIQIFFSILFGIFSSFFIFSFKTKPSYAIENEDNQMNENGNRWMNYKLIVIIYLIFFSIAYVVISLHDNKMILSDFDSILFKSNYAYLLAFLPYALYTLHLGLYALFYEELKNTNLSISIPSEKIIYDHNSKNIL